MLYYSILLQEVGRRRLLNTVLEYLSIDSNEDYTVQKSSTYEFKTKMGKQHHESVITEISYIKVAEDEGS